MVIKMDAASHGLSERVGVQLTIFPSEIFTKKEQLLGPLLPHHHHLYPAGSSLPFLQSFWLLRGTGGGIYQGLTSGK